MRMFSCIQTPEKPKSSKHRLRSKKATDKGFKAIQIYFTKSTASFKTASNTWAFSPISSHSLSLQNYSEIRIPKIVRVGHEAEKKRGVLWLTPFPEREVRLLTVVVRLPSCRSIVEGFVGLGQNKKLILKKVDDDEEDEERAVAALDVTKPNASDSLHYNLKSLPNSKASISRLPNELLLKILSHLPLTQARPPACHGKKALQHVKSILLEDPAAL
ncbi:uncharacterized protein G2W53_017054 [Senna tora]|uniref:F-box domain-containing protein n=1 Tax=Senna tora TaxID=362788 RepID=A0A834WJT9_9FABA|nr:uncharacterized protein G2W53_017054 [Senna tora]